jgi:hypothetical protein
LNFRASGSGPASFPPGTAFTRLTHIKVVDSGGEHPPGAGAMGLWEVMASGGLPALAKLYVTFQLPWGGIEEAKTQVAPALEAVAGTLTHLHLRNSRGGELSGDAVKKGYEVGVAVGKLRRLQNLGLGLSEDGRFYHAVAQGLAASGGDRPLPLLWQLSLSAVLGVNVEQAASLLLPSVRIFVSNSFKGTESGLLIACALRQVGYKHSGLSASAT